MEVILFLDFDGVLHPETAPTDRLFCHVERLAQALSEFPEVRIVVSSSWRETHTMSDILEFLGLLATRVIGATPVRPARSYLPEPLWSYVREGECVAWLRENNRLTTPWLALDDQPWRFSPMCPNLMLTDPKIGLTPVDAKALRARLIAMQKGAQG